MAVMLSDLLRNLTFNRSAHCTQVSDQCPLGLLFYSQARNILYFFIYVLDDNNASVLLFQNLGYFKTFTIQVLVLVSENLLWLDSSFFGRFNKKNRDNLYFSAIFNMLYPEK